MLMRWAPAAFLLFAATTTIAQTQRSTGLEFLDDAAYRSIPLATAPLLGELPREIDLGSKFPAPGDQGAQASCVGWATAYAFKSYQEHVERRWSLTTSSHVFSPAYIYNQINRSGNCNAGTTFVDALNLLRREGVAALDRFPYSDRECHTRPGNLVKQDSKPYAIADWRRVNVQDETEIKANVASGFPVLIGMSVDDGFANLQRGQTYSARSGRPLGGHAMVVVGYNDSRSAFKIINSWGSTWADGGFGWISYTAFRQTVREAYVAQDIVANPSIEPTTTPPNNPIVVPSVIVPPPPAVPQINLGVPTYIHNVLVPSPGGPVPGMQIVVPAAVSNAAGHLIQVVVKFSYFNGPPLFANAQERNYRDIGGLVAVGTPARQVGSNNETLANEPIAIPYYALNFQPMNGVGNYSLSYVAQVYLDNQLAAQSLPVQFGFRW